MLLNKNTKECQMNNFEKIKAMKIDEMAEWMQDFNLDSLCHFCLGCDNEGEEIGCIKGVIQWLQEESEVSNVKNEKNAECCK